MNTIIATITIQGYYTTAFNPQGGNNELESIKSEFYIQLVQNKECEYSIRCDLQNSQSIYWSISGTQHEAQDKINNSRMFAKQTWAWTQAPVQHSMPWRSVFHLAGVSPKHGRMGLGHADTGFLTTWSCFPLAAPSFFCQPRFHLLSLTSSTNTERNGTREK